MLTRGDVAMVLGLAGFLLGGLSFYFGFQTNRRLADAEASLDFDRDTIEQLVNEKTQLQIDVKEANKRVSAATSHADDLQKVVDEKDANALRDALRLGTALADLGRREGIDVLSDVVLRISSDSADAVAAKFFAALELNRIAGRELVAGGADTKAEDRAKLVRASLPAIRTWWAASKDKIRFDAESRRWTTE